MSCESHSQGQGQSKAEIEMVVRGGILTHGHLQDLQKWRRAFMKRMIKGYG